MTAVYFFAGLCIVGIIGIIFLLSPRGKKWLKSLDD